MLVVGARTILPRRLLLPSHAVRTLSTATQRAQSFAMGSNGSSTARAAWLASIDAVYTLFEHPTTCALYPALARKVASAVGLCEQVLAEVGEAHCALSFNGGKDCTVLVHILAAVLRRRNAEQGTRPMAALYITCPSPFVEVDRFIKFCVDPVHGYNLQIVAVDGGMKEGIRTYLNGGGSRQEQGKRDVRAIFVGTRRDDPHGPQLEARSWTDKDWPRVERIHPILEWTYGDVWEFLRCPHLATSESELPFDRKTMEEEWGTTGAGERGVPYCVLYDQGYTSLGSTFNTRPNPQLQQGGKWMPAYMLKDASHERAGRINTPQTPQPPQ
ncbi:adenine nucleotide alpha hydrolases-like protein [Moesziomyces antarcticus]|uniref:FAD synthase n=2 Tax=Pseudozyma antarctica TaxID=84753 RepID=A0A081CNM8_PSEA2|nr:adenine nucleotide alpha hydrolases-like protein [Moesziomyces antarcticus]GAK68274.1 adenine nucleotide alpha hydrolases-like protein [Moesziomyces antarcticus]